MEKQKQNPETVTEETTPRVEATSKTKVDDGGKKEVDPDRSWLPDVSINQQETAVENGLKNFAQNFKKAKRIPDDSMFKLLTAMEKLNVNMELMKSSGDFERLQNGIKTQNVYDVGVPYGDDVKMDKMRFYAHTAENGDVTLKNIAFDPDFSLDQPFFGHTFTDEQKNELKYKGHAGEVIPLTFKGESAAVPCLVSYDQELNRLASVRQDSVRIPDNFLGHHFDETQMEILRNGGAINCEGLTSKAGNTFDAPVMYDAQKRALVPVFSENALKITNGVGDVKFSEEQTRAFHAGKIVQVDGVTNTKTGKQFTSYVRKNIESGRMEFLTPFMGQMIEPKQMRELESGKAVYMSGLLPTKANGEGKIMPFNSYIIRDPESKRILTAQSIVNGVELTNQQVVDFRLGKAIELQNMIDSKGQPFSGYVQKNPNPTSGNAYLYGQKCIPQQEWKEQVNANNKGIGKNKDAQKAITEGATVKKDVTERVKPKNKTSKSKLRV